MLNSRYLLIRLHNDKNILFDMRDKKLLLSVGIPTYEAGESLVVALGSILEQTILDRIAEIIIVVDGSSVSDDIRKQLVHPKVRVVEYSSREGQSARINSIFSLASHKLLILTNDDVVLHKNAIEEILKVYESHDAALISGRVKPLSPQNLFEKTLQDSKSIDDFIIQRWNKGDNYLSANGRLIALSRSFYKSAHIPDKLWNNDAYLYLKAKIEGRICAFAPFAVAYYRLPSKIRDHIRQSLKFQISRKENKKYLGSSIGKLYKTPIYLLIASVVRFFLLHPIKFFPVAGIFLITRLAAMLFRAKSPIKGFWDTDRTTKQLIGAIYE